MRKRLGKEIRGTKHEYKLYPEALRLYSLSPFSRRLFSEQDVWWIRIVVDNLLSEILSRRRKP